MGGGRTYNVILTLSGGGDGHTMYFDMGRGRTYNGILTGGTDIQCNFDELFSRNGRTNGKNDMLRWVPHLKMILGENYTFFKLEPDEMYPQDCPLHLELPDDCFQNVNRWGWGGDPNEFLEAFVSCFMTLTVVQSPLLP